MTPFVLFTICILTNALHNQDVSLHQTKWLGCPFQVAQGFKPTGAAQGPGSAPAPVLSRPQVRTTCSSPLSPHPCLIMNIKTKAVSKLRGLFLVLYSLATPCMRAGGSSLPGSLLETCNLSTWPSVLQNQDFSRIPANQSACTLSLRNNCPGEHRAVEEIVCFLNPWP